MAEKRLNKTLVVAVSLVFFAMIVGLSVLMLSRLQQNDPKYFVDLAQRAAGEGQWRQAAIFYDQAHKRSGDDSYLVSVGEMLLNEGEVAQARDAWNQALVRRPDLISAHQKRIELLLDLAELYGTSSNWDALREAADALIAANIEKTPEQEAFARHARGLALANLTVRDPNNAEAGLAELQKAVELAPQTARYGIDLAAEYARRQKHDQAERMDQELLARYSEPDASSAIVRMACAEHLAARQKLDDAEKMFAESIQFAAGDRATLQECKLAHAGFLMQRWARARLDGSPQAQSYFDECETILKGMVAEDPAEFKPYLQLAVLYKASSRYEDVVRITEDRLRQGLSRKGVKAAHNRVNAFTLMLHASEAAVALALQSAKSGDMDAKEQWLAKAEQYVVDAKGEAPSHPRTMSQMGRVKLARGAERAALEDLRAADDGYRAFGVVNWENKLILADTHLRLNEPGAAKAVLEGVLEAATRDRSRDPLFWNLYAQSLYRTDELERALAVVDRVLLLDPKNNDAARIKAAIYERQGKSELAGEIIRQLTGSSAISAMLRAREASLEGKGEEAVQILTDALAQEPDNVQLVGMAVNELVNLSRHDQAQQIVAAARQKKPDDRWLAQLAVYARADLSEEQRDQALLEQIRSEEDAYKRALDLVLFHSRKSDFAATLKAADEALLHLRDRDTDLARRATASQHAALLKTKIRVAAELKDEAAMAAARDAAAKYDVDGAGGKSILGLYHMQRQEYDLAINALREAVAAQPSDAISLTLLGQCYHLQGRNEDARTAYERAVAANRELALAHQGLAALAKARGDDAAFQAELAVCERLNPNDPWVQEQLLIRTEEKEPQAAITRRERAVQDLKDPYNVQRLASLYERVGDLAKADAKYAELRELRPDDVRVVYSWAEYLRRTDRPDEAVALLTAYASKQEPGAGRDQAFRLLATQYIAQGKPEAAEKCLLDAAGDSPSVDVQRTLGDFYLRNAGDPRKAVDWYTKAIDQAERSNSATLPSLIDARISARLHRANNDFDGARADVETLQRRFPDFARGSLWESEIYSRTGEMDRAVESLSAYLSEQPDDVYALYQRARHRVAQGSMALAVSDLEAIKRINPAALQHEPRLLLARLYRRMGRSELWLRELETVTAESPATGAAVQELAQAYIASKRYDDADRLVTSQINRPGVDAGPWYFLRGQISVDLGQPADALRDFEQAAQADGYQPASVARVLGLYRRLKNDKGGIDYFEGIQSKLTPSPTVTSRYAAVLAGAGRTDDAVRQFRQAMALAIAKEPAAAGAVADDLQAAFPADRALALFQTAPPQDASLQRANNRLLVRIHATAGDYDEAVELLDALIASAPSDAHRAGLLHEKGLVLQQAGRFDESLVAYEQALEYDRNNWVTLNNLAYMLSDVKKENERALQYAQRAVAIADNPFTLDTLGWIYVGLSRYPLAIAELSRAIRLDPDYAWAYAHLGEAHRRAGQFKEAVDILDTARKVAGQAPADPELAKLIDQSSEKARKNESN